MVSFYPIAVPVCWEVLCDTASTHSVSRFSFPALYWAPFARSNDPLTGGGMGQGIQQPPVDQSGGNAFLDTIKVLFEPAAVFERVRARPSFFAPFLTIIAVQC